MTSPALDPIETRLFRRGVSDQEVRVAVELVREYIHAHADAALHGDAAGWWGDFAVFQDDLSRNFTPAQVAAFEIAIDTLLVHAGMPTWTATRALQEPPRPSSSQRQAA